MSQDTPSFYKQMVQQQKQALSRQGGGPGANAPLFSDITVSKENDCDSDDDLAYLLNKREAPSQQKPQQPGIRTIQQ